jgi:ATP-dependent Lhr-like helicase
MARMDAFSTPGSPDAGGDPPDTADILDRFHPAVASWFRRAFPRGATPTQARAWAVTSRGGHALVSAPTGSGKTLAAFLAAIDDLVVRGERAPLPDRVQVLYVSPLKALSNDVEKNLQAPLCGIRDRLFELGRPDVGVRTAVRTGDTTASERALMRRQPPHILVTTPESLFILLGSESGRAMLSGTRSVIVDELHALAGSKRGAHLMLSLERLSALCEQPPVRIGLSATVKPIETIADYLVGGKAGHANIGTADSSGAGTGQHIPTDAAIRCDGNGRGAQDRAGSRAGIGDGTLQRFGSVFEGAGPQEGSGDCEPRCAIIDAGHARRRDLALVLPGSPLDAVMSNEVWGEVYDRLADLVSQHRTTLVFVNQRRLAERVARHLAERIGEQHVTAHHGSLAKEHRFDAEQRLKAGKLKALVATSSLELGIDIGDIDLVCQLGSPRWISAFLQRVGRAGHAIGAVPKGRLFPLTLDDLLECSALLDAVARGELDRIRDVGTPLDVLSQQIVAEVGSRECGEAELFDLVRRAAPYRQLTRQQFDDVVRMLGEGYTTRRGRRGAYLHHDTVNGRLRPRRGARLVAATNAGVIPDQFDSDVVLLPEEMRIGTLNEDFAFESLPGDIFQLGNTSYRIAKVETGKVYVEDAKGQPPTLPFWLGESLGRSDELSFAVSRLVSVFDAALDGEHDLRNPHGPETVAQPGLAAHAQGQAVSGIEPAVAGDGDPLSAAPGSRGEVAAPPGSDLDAVEQAIAQRVVIGGVPAAGVRQLAHYLGVARAMLGTLPTLDTIVMERFFDEVGDTHLVIHSPYGSRINKAWGLALRKRFCRQFNFELQASALEDSIVLSLGPTHSFPLEDVCHFLKSATAREILVQALLDAPMFPTRFRWTGSIALALRRMNGGKRVPPQFQRSDAEDLLTVVFPDQVACAENLTGEREIPDHPLVAQALHDCLHETMDVDGFLALLGRMERGEVRVVCRDLPAPSPLANAILSAKPYAFLDDGEAEERRTRAVATQRLSDIDLASASGQIDPAAVAQVRDDAWPRVRDPDELHDALVVHGFLTDVELRRLGEHLLAPLVAQRRAAQVRTRGGTCVVAAERVAEFAAAVPGAHFEPALDAELSGAAAHAAAAPDAALRELLRGRLELLGPVSEAGIGAPLGVEPVRIGMALLQLEGEGTAMQGHFDAELPTDEGRQWCERRLLARIHRLSRDRRRAQVQAVTPARFLDFLAQWHGLAGTAGEAAREGEAALAGVLQQLEGWAAPAAAWERDILPRRLRGYTPDLLDRLCVSGRIAWWRPGSAAQPRKAGPLRSTPIMLVDRASLAIWQSLASAAGSDDKPATPPLPVLGSRAQRVFDCLRSCGALFFSDIERETRLLRAELEDALGELVAQGVAGCDSFAGLRALIVPAAQRTRRGARAPDIDHAGRWTLLRTAAARPPQTDDAARLADPAVEHVARVLLRRYGVVFRALLAREQDLPPWRDLHYVYRRMEARGEIRGGRFVSGFAGEQFALPDAVAMLRRQPGEDGLVAVSAADPLNLVGIVTPGDKVPALAGNRVAYRRGAPVAARTGGEVRHLVPLDDPAAWAVQAELVRNPRSLPVR